MFKSIQGFTQKLTSKLNQTVEVLQPKLQQLKSETSNRLSTLNSKMQSTTQSKKIHQLNPQLYLLHFSSQDQLQIQSLLQKQFDTEYTQLINVGEKKQCFMEENTMNYNMVGYSNNSLDQILVIISRVIHFMSQHPNNQVILYCQETRSRSILIASCLLVILNNLDSVFQATKYICEVTDLDDKKVFFPSQLKYLKYFDLIKDGIRIQQQSIRIDKILINGIPIIKGQQEFRPYLQIFQNSQIMYNSFENGTKEYNQKDQTLWFDDFNGLEVEDDFLLRIKHYHSSEIRYPIIRLQMNSNFIQSQVLRLYKQDLDCSFNVMLPDDFFIDIMINIDRSQFNKNYFNVYEGCRDKYIESQKTREVDYLENKKEEPEVVEQMDYIEQEDEDVSQKKAVLTSIIQDINEEHKQDDEDFDDYLAKLEEES